MTGILYLFVGNSGSGKDSIIRELAKREGFVAPKRFITRPEHGDSEDFISVKKEEFNKMLKNGDFVLSWKSYGKYYGISKDIIKDLEKGLNVLVNVSRTVVRQARKKYGKTIVVFLRVPYELSRKRLLERGREDASEIRERLDRAGNNQEFSGADLVIDSSGVVSETMKKVNKFI